MAFRRDVAYLDEYVPEYVDLNAEEFKRVVRLLESVLPELASAYTRVQWEGKAQELYSARLREAESLAHDLREAFEVAGPALDAYGQALCAAKGKLAEGDAAADALANLMRPIIWYQTPKFQSSEPLAQWEDLREVTSWTDAAAEGLLQDRIDRIRGAAEALYQKAAHLYDEARAIEQHARAECLERLRAASRKLPDFQANSTAARLIIEWVPGVMAEMREAAAIDTGVRLPGQGVVAPFGIESGSVSETHMDLRDRAANVSFSGESWDTGDSVSWYAPIVGDRDAEHEFKLDWVKNYSPVIRPPRTSTAYRPRSWPASCTWKSAASRCGPTTRWTGRGSTGSSPANRTTPRMVPSQCRSTRPPSPSATIRRT
jgi:hypothetical protein